MSTIIVEYKQTNSASLRENLTDLTPDQAAIAILGSELVTPHCRVRIVELEAYANTHDPASHAHRGMTKRNAVMHTEPGRLYMYFVYGNHWMANIVCRPHGEAGALLIRAAMPISGTEALIQANSKPKSVQSLLSGPGKLCSALGLSGQHNRTDLLDASSPIRLETGTAPRRVAVTTRVGIAPGKGDDKLWRFIDYDAMKWASRPHPQ